MDDGRDDRGDRDDSLESSVIENRENDEVLMRATINTYDGALLASLYYCT